MSRRRPGGRALVDELQAGHRTTMVTLTLVLLISVLSSAYLLLIVQPRVQSVIALNRADRLLHEAMLDQETGLRGWLATGDRIFLQPYAKGSSNAQSATNDLRRLGAADTSVAAQIATVASAKTDWEDWARRAEQHRYSQAQRTSGTLTDFLLEGKDLFDSYRTAQTALDTLLVQRRAAALQDQTAGLAAGLILILVVLTTTGLYSIRRRQRLQRLVLTPIIELLKVIDALRGGDLTARTSVSGVREVDQVGAELGGLASSLDRAEKLNATNQHRLEVLATRLAAVVSVGREISGSLSVPYIAEAVAASAAILLDAPVILWLRDDTGGFIAVRRSSDPHGITPPTDLPPSHLVASAAADAGDAIDGTAQAYPLLLAGMVIAVLEAPVAQLEPAAAEVLHALLSTAAAALESARLHSATTELAFRDALTQLANRRRLDVDLEAEWQRSCRYDRPLTFVMLDLDHFKALNDQHGHLLGDEALHAVADAIVAALRSTDTAYRYGGEEIAVILRETRLTDAKVVAERIRAAVAGVRVGSAAVAVSCSIGVAELDAGALDWTDLVAQADAALYRAKRTGRNRVVAATPAPQPV